MADNQWIIPVGVAFAIVAVGAGLFYTWQPDDPLIEDSVREVRIAQLREQIGLNENQKLMWAPWLTSETYDIGTVFPLDGFGQAYSTACNSVTSQDVDLSLSLGGVESFDLSANLDVAKQVGIETTGRRAVTHQMTVDTAKVAPAFAEMLQDLYNDPDCLAAVASRPVLVLYARYRGDETYTIRPIP